MEEKHLIILLLLALCAVVLLVIVVVLNNIGKSKIINIDEEEKTAVAIKKALAIEDLIDIVANRNSTRNDLVNAVMKVSNEFPFPSKTKGKVTKEAKVYLNFILLVASHKKADAKLVAFMNTEIKKKNSEYNKEIDIYESEGIRQRGNRI